LFAIFLSGAILLIFSDKTYGQTVGIFYDMLVSQHAFAVGDIKSSLEAEGLTVELRDLSTLDGIYAEKKVVIALESNAEVASLLVDQGGSGVSDLGEQAYALRTTTSSSLSYWILGGDDNGAMYGALEMAENISFNGYSGTYNTQETPFMLNRGMKLNLPLDKRIPTYVGGWSSNSAKQAIPAVWDSIFWKTLIDQQARNRYNMLSIWVHHPFPALVKLADYPNASLPSIEGFDGFAINMDHDARVAFWRRIMQYAHSRGMTFYFFNWNVYIDYAEDQYPALTQDRTNTTTKDYMYKSMQALIATYPELDGFGISAGDGMSSDESFNSNTEKTDWTYDCFGKAVKDYLVDHPSRKFNLIHRGIGTNFKLMNSTYQALQEEPNATVNFSIKYAMAHMYSTPTPDWGTGELSDVADAGKKTWITLRNDDYFYINWGDHQFVRDFLNGIPDIDAVTGMYVGSDGYNPSRTYFCKNDDLNGQLEVERRWYMEMLWGRLSYNPQISNDVFTKMLAKRFPTVNAGDMFKAWTLASRPLPKVTELVMRNWSLDFHWWPEACWSDPGRCSGFRTIDTKAGVTDLAKSGFDKTDVAKGSNLCNIANSAAGKCSGKKSSYTLADEIEADGIEALNLANAMSSDGNVDLEMAINNIKQMAHLSCYYAYKIRGATYKKAGQTENARNEMAKAYCSWMNYKNLMENDYYADEFRNVSILPDWSFADAMVLKEYTDLGGSSKYDCADPYPWVAIEKPLDNEFFTEPANVSVTINADAGSNAIEKIELRSNDILIHTVYESPLRLDLEDMLLGSYFLEARVYDDQGNIEYDTCHIKVYDSYTLNGVPWVEEFTHPDGTTFDEGPSSWTSSRSSGILEVQNNQFVVNEKGSEGVLKTSEIDISKCPVDISLELQTTGNLESDDYVKLYKIVDNGTEELIGKKTGNQPDLTSITGTASGNTLELVLRTKVSFGSEYYYMDNLKVNFNQGCENQIPEIYIAAPDSGTEFMEPAHVMIDIEASDPDGTIDRLEVRSNGSLVKSSFEAPYNISLSNLSRGNYTLLASVFDNNGASSSSSVNIIIKSNGKQNQTLTFPKLPEIYLGDDDFNPGASASSGYTVSYASSNTKVASIENGLIRVVGGGTTEITASQSGDDIYNPAPDVYQTLRVIADTYSEIYDYNVSLYPNPTSNEVYISVPEEYSIELIDLKGVEIIKQSHLVGLHKIYIQYLDAGIYFLKISGKNYQAVRKLIKN